jgi:hypothetical protein
MQIAAAVALALSGAKDREIQDSARHLTAIPPLVEMAACYCAPASEVARLTLLALKHHNTRNADEISCALRRRGMCLDECMARLSSGCAPECVPARCCARLAGLVDELDCELSRAACSLAPAQVFTTPPPRRCR